MRFGVKVDYDDFIKEAFKFTTKLSKDYITAKQILVELYETKYNIHNHALDTGVMSSVKFNKAETYTDHYLRQSYLDLYLYKSINKYLGISFDDFIDRPKSEIDELVARVDAFRVKEAEVGKDALDALKNASGANGQ